MNTFIDYFVPSQDPILGIKCTNLVKTLDQGNWHSKAIVRPQEHSRHYIYLSRATSTRDRKHYYCVTTYDIDQGAILFRQLFQTSSEALAHANQTTPNLNI